MTKWLNYHTHNIRMNNDYNHTQARRVCVCPCVPPAPAFLYAYKIFSLARWSISSVLVRNILSTRRVSPLPVRMSCLPIYRTYLSINVRVRLTTSARVPSGWSLESPSMFPGQMQRYVPVISGRLYVHYRRTFIEFSRL